MPALQLPQCGRDFRHSAESGQDAGVNRKFPLQLPKLELYSAVQVLRVFMEGKLGALDELIDPGDLMIADSVHEWTRKKHDLLRGYIRITAGARKMFTGARKPGTTFIDMFCATGRSRVEETNKWIDGSAQMAWKESVSSGCPFSQIYIADLRDDARAVCAERLRREKAPVYEVQGNAIEAAENLIGSLNPHALHFVFLDPYNLRELDFRILKSLSDFKHIDLIVHISTMDLQRNLAKNLAATDSVFDYFCPNWRSAIDRSGNKAQTRAQIIEFWKRSVRELGVWPSKNMKLISGHEGQRLYWLLIAAKHPLAQKLWSVAANPEGQRELFSDS